MTKTLCVIVFILTLGVATVYASPQVISDITTVEVTAATEFIFTPESTGYWVFETSHSVGGRPRLRLTNMYSQYIGSCQTVRDNDDVDSRLKLHLVGGVDYQLGAWQDWGVDSIGSFTLSVFMVDSFEAPNPYTWDDWDRWDNWDDIWADPWTPEIIEIPSDGGLVSGEFSQGFSFTPKVTGHWAFELTNFRSIEITDSFDNEIMWIRVWDMEHLEKVTVHLVAGAEYSIFVIRDWQTDEDFTVNIFLYDSAIQIFPIEYLKEAGLNFDADFLPVSVGENEVTGGQMFSFTPDTTGPWHITTTDFSGNNDSMLVISDQDITFLVYDENWGRRRNTMGFTLYLAEGVEYMIWMIIEGSSEELAFYDGDFVITIQPYEGTVTEEVTETTILLPPPPPHLESVPEPETRTPKSSIAIPPTGGRITVPVYGAYATVFTFTPETTQTWAIQPNHNAWSLTMSDPSGSFYIEGWRDGIIIKTLAQGVEYTIYVRGRQGGELLVSPYSQIVNFSEGVQNKRFVHQQTDFTFTPDTSGIWFIRTYDFSVVDTYLWLLDAYGNVIAEDDNSYLGLNSMIRVELVAGEVYTIRAGFYGGSVGSYWLYVSMLDMYGPQLTRLESPAIR